MKGKIIMGEKLIETKQDQPVLKKKVYIPPTLIVYGKISDLTKSGGTGKKESLGGKRPA
jgi:hypothetical protein